MKKRYTTITMLVSIAPLLFADTNALIEVKLFKTWVIAGENIDSNINIAIKNTGADPIRLAQDSFLFTLGQFALRPLPRKLDTTEEDQRQEREYRMIKGNGGRFLELPLGETHVYEGWKFFTIAQPMPFSKEMRFTVSVYLGNGFYLDSEALTLKGVVPDSEEHIATITNVNGSRDLVAVTYNNERWLYTKLGELYSEVCPVSLTSKIRVEPHDGKSLHKIWDGEKSMIYRLGHSILTEGPDENNVFGKWTRERKQKAEADNAEVRRRKAEQQ